MHCRQHNTWDCGSSSCFAFYQGRGYTHSGMLEWDATSGGMAVNIGGGMAIDLETGDLGVDVGGVVVDI